MTNHQRNAQQILPETHDWQLRRNEVPTTRKGFKTFELRRRSTLPTSSTNSDSKLSSSLFDTRYRQPTNRSWSQTREIPSRLIRSWFQRKSILKKKNEKWKPNVFGVPFSIWETCRKQAQRRKNEDWLVNYVSGKISTTFRMEFEIWKFETRIHAIWRRWLMRLNLKLRPISSAAEKSILR